MFAGINKLIDSYKSHFPVSEPEFGLELGLVSEKEQGEDIDVQRSLTQLLHKDEWNKTEQSFLHGWNKKLDIAKKHFTHYQSHWLKTAEAKPLDEKLYELSAVIIYRRLGDLFNSDFNKTPCQAETVKTANVLLKVLDRINKQDFASNKNQIIEDIKQIMANIKIEAVESLQPTEIISQSRVLDLTVLFSEGPIARAYLETIESLGFKVKKIIRIVSSVDLVSRKPVAKLLPQSMKLSYAANKQYKQMFYWPEYLKKKYPAQFENLQQELDSTFRFKQQHMLNALRKNDLDTYSDDVDELFITGLKDQELHDYLLNETENAILYTGGGIVPASLLNITGLKLIHIHPGFLPDIRGADCVLWSLLLRGTTSASAFYMSPGIDTGDIILPCWLPQADLCLSKEMDVKSQYRFTYAFFDPWVRAFVLRELLMQQQSNLKQIKAVAQNKDVGMTYHFMHSFLKESLFKATP